jgi:hypothetical protein
LSPSLRRSLSPSRRWANVLAVCSGVTFATLAGSAFGQTCGATINGATVGRPVTVSTQVGAYQQTVLPGVIISWGDGTSSGGAATGPFALEPPPFLPFNTYYLIQGTHTYSAATTGVQITVRGFLRRLNAVQIPFSCSTVDFDVVEPGPPPPGGDGQSLSTPGENCTVLAAENCTL